MLGNPAGPGGAVQRAGLWPLAPAPAPAPTGANFSADGFGKYGLYSLLPGASAFGNATYSHCSIGRLTTGAAAASIQPSSATAFHATHKDSLFASGYTLGAPTPPPGSPYSPVPVTQLEFLTKGFNSNIIIQQPEFSPSPTKKHQIQIQEVPTKTTITPPYSVDAVAKCCGRSVKLCSCHLHVKTPMLGGCSRTNPLEWSPVSVKKEPPATPCQVAEITTSGETPLVKLEVASPNNGNINKETIIAPPIVTTNGNIPVGIAVARQRIQHNEVVSSPSLPPAGLLTTVNTTHIKEVARISEIDAAGMAAATGGVPTTGGTLFHCSDERAFPGWPMGSAHGGSTLAAPTLWQYPVSPMPVEPLMSMPMPPVGFQLVRDPNTGGLLLLPPAEQLQQTVVWPSYHQPSSHVLLPPFHPPPLHLLSSASSDYLQTSTTLHQHTQTHSTRLLAVTTDTTKRKIPMPIPTTTLIKIETDDQSKTLQAVSTIATNTPTTVYTDQNIAPLVTTHVIYQHPTNLILSSQTQETTACRSQATSPVACLTPPPEINHEEETTVQDASNQTDALIEETTSTPEKTLILSTEQQEPETPELKVEGDENQETIPDEQPDLSGLELLSNSIEEFEKLDVTQPPVQPSETVQLPAQCEVVEGIAQMTLKDKEKEDLGGLGILCALAEQRILECERAERKKRKSKKHHEEPRSKKPKPTCSCSPDLSRKEDQYKTYKTKESEEEVKKFLASKSQPMCCKGDWPFMNAMELEMRMRLADLQRKYREKQRELSKLKPKKTSSSSNNNNINTTATNTNSNTPATVATSNEKKRARKKSTTPPPPHLDKIDPIKPNTKSSHELLKPPTLCPYETIPKSSPSKKRKVGRPKKLLTISGSPTLTETIFAKKPKKGSLVGYVLAAKEKLMHNSTLMRSESPPRFVDNDVKKTKKIRPKLKAEVKLQSEDEQDEEQEEDVEYNEFDEEITPVAQSKKIDNEGTESFKDLENNNVIEEKKEEEIEENDKAVVKEEVHNEEEVEEAACEEEDEDEDKITDTRCSLTTELLAKDKLRVLTAMGGLFYAGKLHAVQPPDVYSITLDGERGNKPHIMSREEILRDAIVEVSPTSTSELTAGTRLCAYWSQQYRCLYPGSVAEPEVDADPSLDSRFVSVEFDDGDSGRIALEDIRLLPPDYPIIEYDPNPLLSLSKRRRRTSTTDERRSIQSITPIPEAKALSSTPTDATAERHREKKRMKKRKREKMLLKEDKKRRKKHKCTDDNCKHRKHHKKRRKHKRHHHKESSHHVPVVEEREEEDREEVELETITHVATVEEEEEFEAEAEEETSNQFANPEDEVTMDDILEAAQNQQQNKKIRDRQESCESRSKMSAFLPARQLWGWSGKGYKRPKGKGRSRKQFFKAIQRGKEAIMVGDSAVFLSTGRPDRPYIGRIEAMWESCGTMVVKVKWFYHPEETVGCPLNLKYPGALFESPHVDENDVQTISHKCEVLPLKEYTTKLGDDPRSYETIYDNNDIYYLAGNYDPTTTTLKMEPEIPFN
ncbi:PREDICTED: protein winged eye [Nicrophorus vespilloides]|uniref:Protein winged eye n=1 Tax=Nicrophorus vespilloides TaxID=110193 RepID=A0ABM1MJ69_NICVS|nr:PREDICTED: protein winged eye [Nicrophorus vespilloides]